jgi:hypothetical protein
MDPWRCVKDELELNLTVAVENANGLLGEEVEMRWSGAAEILYRVFRSGGNGSLNFHKNLI